MFVQVWSFLICVVGIILVSEAETCQETAPQLYRAVSRFAWTAFILAIACLITSVSTAIFIYLMRHGHLTTSDAAPQAIERCRIIKQGDELLQEEDGEAASCPICMDVLDDEKVIRATPCNHTFHEQCLSGWLNVSRCCPMCRFDLLENNAPPARHINDTSHSNNSDRVSATATAQQNNGNANSPAALASTYPVSAANSETFQSDEREL